jgi:IS4 transposase
MRKYHILWRFRKELKLLGIDSSFIKINRDFAKLGYCSSTKSIEKGIKIHLAALLGKLTLPITAMITPGDVSDQKEFDYLLEDCSVMIDLTKVILVFDKGIKFITLMKKGTVYEVLSEKNWKNISDKRIRLSNGLELRLIQIKTEDGIGEYLTNIFDLSAMDIVHAYEQRWIIEIFFREIKSYFKIDHFMSKNLNGMLIQIFCTLTAYALMVLFRVIYDLYWISILEIKRYLKYNIIEGNLHGLKCSNNAIV